MPVNLDILAEQQANRAKLAKESESALRSESQMRFQDDARRRIADETARLNSGFSRRGLLYSGLNQGAQAGARSQVGQDVAQGVAGVNEQLTNQTQGLQDVAFGTGVAAREQAQQRLDADYNRRIAEIEAKKAAKTSVGGVLGSITGGLLGRA